MTNIVRAGKIWSYTTIAIPFEVWNAAKSAQVNFSKVCTTALKIAAEEKLSTNSENEGY